MCKNKTINSVKSREWLYNDPKSYIFIKFYFTEEISESEARKGIRKELHLKRLPPGVVIRILPYKARNSQVEEEWPSYNSEEYGLLTK